MTTRIVTDVPAARVGFVIAINRAAGGVLVSQEDEGDGEFTLVFEFPDAAASTTPPAALRADVAGAARRRSGARPAAALAEPPAATPTERWLEAARAELGTGEVAGDGNNPRIVAYHASTDGGPAADSVPWCSSFVNFCVQKAGVQGTRSKAARSWIEWGRPSEFVPGAIVVLKRGAPPKGHVGFFVGADNGRIQLLGGNQADRVSIASFDASIVLACRTAP